MYYRQHAPIYGETSAPIHWENTLFPFLIDGKTDGVQVEEAFLNFERGDNEPCVLYHKERDFLFYSGYWVYYHELYNSSTKPVLNHV